MAEYIRVSPHLGLPLAKPDEKLILARWDKKVGETIKRGEIIAEIETWLGTVEIESEVDGKLLEFLYHSGDVVPAGANIAIVDTADKSTRSLPQYGSERGEPIFLSQTADQNFLKDVFICHAGEDKASVARPLAVAFYSHNISYWFDEAEILWADSITKKVNEGLRISRYVIVVLSANFLNKPWPEREFYSALNLEASSGEVRVLPLVVGDKKTQQAIMEKYPLINDKNYLTWSGNTQIIVDALKKRLGRNG